MFTDAIHVGMAELKVAKAPQKLASLGLGSCVAVCAYDRDAKIGGLAHVMLPSSLKVQQNANPAKFANTAVPLLLSEMVKLGAMIYHIKVNMVGGANMFSFTSEDSSLNIGNRNIQAVELACAEAKISIIAKEVGGNSGRSVLFDLSTGKVEVRTIGQGVIKL